jgi:hypothetical protein
MTTPHPITMESVVVGKSARMRAVFEFLRVIGNSESTVLITGESGTGKEVMATLIHQTSRRKHHPFVAVSCALFTSLWKQHLPDRRGSTGPPLGEGLLAGGEGIGRTALDVGDADEDVAMPVASNDEARREVRELEGEAHAVFVGLNIGQRSGPSVQCFPRSHATFLAGILCKVTASMPRPDRRDNRTGGAISSAFSGRVVTKSHPAGNAALPGGSASPRAGSRRFAQGMLIAPGACVVASGVNALQRKTR